MSTGADVRTALVADGPGAVPRWRGRRWLIALQVAVSLVLLSMATVSADQVRRELHRDTGIALDHLAVATVDFANQRVDDVSLRPLAEQIVAQLQHEPAIIGAAATSGLPFGITNPMCGVTTPDKPLIEDKFYGSSCELILTTPGGLDVLGVGLLKGRTLTDRDREGTQKVAVVSASLAKVLFGTTDVLGREVQVQKRRWVGMPTPPVVTRTIVGVASDTQGRNDSPALTVYLPFSQETWGLVTFAARTIGDPNAAVTSLRRAIAAVAPGIATADLGTAMTVTGASDGPLQVVASVSGLLGLFALVLALAGLYGVLSHVVARRVREMGIRVALGATSQHILKLIIGDGLRPIVLGVVLGLVLGGIARVALRPVFVRAVPTIDPLVVAIAPLLILLAGALASYLPARRGARVDPNVALRQM
jgi:putative ABC transport system permease protein